MNDKTYRIERRSVRMKLNNEQMRLALAAFKRRIYAVMHPRTDLPADSWIAVALQEAIDAAASLAQGDGVEVTEDEREAAATLAAHGANPRYETRDAAISAAFVLARKVVRNMGCPKCGDTEYHPWCPPAEVAELDADVIQADGDLYSLGWYLAWTVGEKTACLDGRFTAGELMAIARHMATQGAQGDGVDEGQKS